MSEDPGRTVGEESGGHAGPGRIGQAIEEHPVAALTLVGYVLVWTVNEGYYRFYHSTTISIGVSQLGLLSQLALVAAAAVPAAASYAAGYLLIGQEGVPILAKRWTFPVVATAAIGATYVALSAARSSYAGLAGFSALAMLFVAGGAFRQWAAISRPRLVGARAVSPIVALVATALLVLTLFGHRFIVTLATCLASILFFGLDARGSTGLRITDGWRYVALAGFSITGLFQLGQDMAIRSTSTCLGAPIGARVFLAQLPVWGELRATDGSAADDAWMADRQLLVLTESGGTVVAWDPQARRRLTIPLDGLALQVPSPSTASC